MTEKDKKNDDFITQDGKLNLHVMVRTVLQQYMGKAVDYARLSGMADRSFQQFERLVKDDCYRFIEYSAKILEAHGYEDPTKKP